MPNLRYEPIAVSSESTVVAEYTPDTRDDPSYQSEAELERQYLRLRQSQAYEYLPLTSEEQLVANLRTQLATLDGITFSDGEWQRLFVTSSASKNEGIVEKSVRLQEDHVQILRR